MDAYDHTQGASDTTWTISHNLNTDAVAVDVFINNGGNVEKVLPLTVTATSNNTLTVTFSTAQTGYARVIGTKDAV